jgi:hypothetical protein
MISHSSCLACLLNYIYSMCVFGMLYRPSHLILASVLQFIPDVVSTLSCRVYSTSRSLLGFCRLNARDSMRRLGSQNGARLDDSSPMPDSIVITRSINIEMSDLENSGKNYAAFASSKVHHSHMLISAGASAHDGIF